MAKRLEAGSLDGEAQKEVEMALEELDVMWEELQGQAALLITDAGGNVREANRAAQELLGEALAGRPVASLVPEDDRVAFLTRFVGAISSPEGRLSWQGRVAPDRPAQFSVRTLPLRKSGVAGLCWLIRPL
jgi:PAS domain S-box-containing protein